MKMATKLAVDIVLVREDRGVPEILLVKRRNNPYKGMYALPGGKVEQGEQFSDAATRELLEETGITDLQLELLGLYKNEDAINSVAFLGRVANDYVFTENNEVEDFTWFKIDEIPQLAGNHNEIVKDAVKRLVYTFK